MTDKQIKDGIDVSQCECYSIEYNSCNRTISGSCIKENCQIFRLLQTIKAKEQECEELKETFDGLFKVQYKLADTNKKLRQCLTEIKEIAEKRNYLDYNECLDDILQKISEVEDG